MITLTTPPVVNSVLGGNAPISYNKFVISNVSIDTINQRVVGDILLTSTASPDMQPIAGTLLINTLMSKLTIAVEKLDFYRQVTLTGPQVTNIINTIVLPAQNTIENGLLTLGVTAGTHSSGT